MFALRTSSLFTLMNERRTVETGMRIMRPISSMSGRSSRMVMPRSREVPSTGLPV